MSKFLNAIAACLIATATALPLAAAPFGLGRAALPEEIAAWDVDVLPDGRGLPEGQGDVLTGEAIFTDNCAACHGPQGKGGREFGAPNLSDAIWLRGGDRADLRRQILGPRMGVMPAWGERLDPVTIKMLAAYVHSLGGGEDFVEVAEDPEVEVDE